MTDGHRARKRFGQNFLHDQRVIDKILDAVRASETDHIVEIGPGLGALTEGLCAAGRLDVIELDRDLAGRIRQRFQHLEHFTLHEADALRFDFGTLGPGPIRLVGNLPYNISTPLIFHLLDCDAISDMHFMLQKEVVERMAAGPGSKAYSPLSVMCQYHCRVSPLFTVGAGAFSPAPKVESAIVRLLPHDTPPVDTEPALLRSVVKRAFSQRRKTLRNALSGILSADQLRAAGVDPAERAERLSLQDFAALCQQVDKDCE